MKFQTKWSIVKSWMMYEAQITQNSLSNQVMSNCNLNSRQYLCGEMLHLYAYITPDCADSKNSHRACKREILGLYLRMCAANNMVNLLKGPVLQENVSQCGFPLGSFGNVVVRLCFLCAGRFVYSRTSGCISQWCILGKRACRRWRRLWGKCPGLSSVNILIFY